MNEKEFSENLLSIEEAEKMLASYTGFQKEKFIDYIILYRVTKGNFSPPKEIICYAGAPGTGKTSFVKVLSQAMDRKLKIIACAGLKEFKEYSILGDENKPSLVAWVIKDTGCSNPIILLDELEKVEEDSPIQKDLIKLFDMYKNEEEGESKKLFDKHYQKNIELDRITFFATVNYPEKLSPRLKLEMNMQILENYSNEEKEAILKLKRKEITESCQKICDKKENKNEDDDIIPDTIIKELPEYIRESGIRQTERVLRKIQEKYIYCYELPEKEKEFPLGDPKKWLKDNILPYQESFQPKLKHYCLFGLWGINWILLLVVIIKKLILKKNSTNNKINQNESKI